MTHRLSALLLSLTVLAAPPLFSQTPTGAAAGIAAGAAAEASAAEGPFPLLLLALADGDGSAWDPSWPADAPPDAFIVKNADARSIELFAEVADAEGAAAEGAEAAGPIRARWDDRGRLLEFPFATQGELSQVAVRRSAAGRIMKLGVTAMKLGKPAEAGASGGGPGAALSIAFAYGADGLAESASLEGEGAGSFAFTYRGARDEAGKPRGSALETRAGESGEVTGVFDYAFGGGRIVRVDGRGETGERVPLRSTDYDASGRVVAVTEGSYRAEALYAARGRVVYWRIAASAESSGADNESTDAATERRFQWDERGFLVRESVTEAGEAYEVRYEYATDSRGNWVERKASRWVQRFGALVNEGGTRVRRTIRYR